VIVIGTKLDATTDRTRLEKLRDYCAEHRLEFHSISSASGEGIPQLVRAMADALDRISPPRDEADDAAGGTANSSIPSEKESTAHTRQTDAARKEDH
jgi:hypothetical protein